MNTTTSEWFASDRFHRKERYVFMYSSLHFQTDLYYEAMEQQEIIRLAQIHSLKETWTDKQAVTEALQRLKAAISHKPKERRAMDFEFVIDDHTTYYLMSPTLNPQKPRHFSNAISRWKKTIINKKKS